MITHTGKYFQETMAILQLFMYRVCLLMFLRRRRRRVVRRLNRFEGKSLTIPRSDGDEILQESLNQDYSSLVTRS